MLIQIDADVLRDLLALKFSTRRLAASERHNVESFRRLFLDQKYDLLAEERHILWRLDEIEKQKAKLLASSPHS